MLCFQQRCFAHGIQFAIIGVLCKPLPEEKNQGIFQETDNANQSELSGVDDDGFPVKCSLISVKIANYKNLVSKFRKTEKIFRKSLTKNYLILQKYVQEEHCKILEFILDCITCWCFLVIMLEGFHALRLYISKDLIDLRSDIQFIEE